MQGLGHAALAASTLITSTLITQHPEARLRRT
jgi:hypothetical protein